MYYISINKERLAIITTSRKHAARHVGVHDITLSRVFKERSWYECSSGSVYVTDSVIKQSRGFAVVRKGGGGAFKPVRKA